jgi:hypothetical protein
MQQVNLDVDLDINVGMEGVTTDLYIGENDNHIATQTTDWETIIDDVFTMHCLQSGELVYEDYIKEFSHTESVDEIMNTAQSMIDAGERLKERVYNSKVFLRDKWLQAGTPESKEEFSVSYGDYCEHRLILEGHINE